MTIHGVIHNNYNESQVKHHSNHISSGIQEKTQAAALNSLTSHTFTSSSVNPLYHEVVRRASDVQIEKIEKILKALPEKDKHIESLLKAMDSLWEQSTIFANPDHPFYALLAFKRGQITQMQLGTLLQFWCVGKHYTKWRSPVSFDVFEDPKVIQEILAKHPDSYIRRDVTEMNLNDLNLFSWMKLGDFSVDFQQFKKFTEIMESLPKSEQQFLIVPYEPSISKTIFDQLINIGVNLFSVFTNEKDDKIKRFRMIPSIGMMQALLIAMHGEKQAVNINPVFGISSVDDIRANGLNHIRDLALQFPLVPLPLTADGFAAYGPDFTYHDFYHAFIASCMPRGHRELMIKLSDEFRVKGLGKYRFALIDMEHSFYRPDFIKKHKQDFNAIFWISIAYKLRHFDDKLHTSSYKLAKKKIIHLLAEREIGLEHNVTALGLKQAVNFNGDLIVTAPGGKESIKQHLRELYKEKEPYADCGKMVVMAILCTIVVAYLFQLLNRRAISCKPE